MAERRYVWADGGLASAADHGVTLSDVVEALHAPDGLRVERELGDLLLIVIGMAESARVVAVVCERIATQHTYYRILIIRPVLGGLLDEWRDHLS